MSYNTKSHNDKVTIYPSPSGWRRIKELVGEHKAEMRKVGTFPHLGYRDQLWVIIHDLNPLFFNGQRYFMNTDITFDEE